MTDQVTTDLTAREIAHEQEFVDVVYRQLEASTRNAPRRWPARATAAPGSATRAGWSSATRWSSRRPSGSPPSTPRTRGWSSAASTSRTPPRRRATSAGSACATSTATPCSSTGAPRRPRCSTRPRPPSPRASYAAGCCAAPAAPSSASRTTCSTPRPGTELPVIGEGALMAQLSRARDRSMHSIVATIQAEQDKAIRAPSKGVVEISGGPGTGKTVVALHRAAYLLYTDRARYERGGVLVVGPSGVFMRYIERVLPSLGETAVALRSLGEVVDGISADPPRRRRRSPTSRARPGWPSCMRRTARQAVPGAPRGVPLLLPRRHPRARRPRPRPDPPQPAGPGPAQQAGRAGWPAALVDALWRQVRGERALERGREEFVDTMLGDDTLPRLRARLVAAARRHRGARAGCATPSSWRRVGEGVLSADDLEVLSSTARGGRRTSRSRTCR